MAIEDEIDVTELLEDFGRDLTLTRAGTPTYDSSTGELTNAAGSTISVRGVFIYNDLTNADGTVVRAGDRRLLITATGATGVPQRGDRVDGSKIEDVRPFEPGGVVVAWDCQVVS